MSIQKKQETKVEKKIPLCEEMKGWKVICAGSRFSFSQIHNNPYAVCYNVNEFTRSTLGGCNLFFFPDRDSAESWIEGMDYEVSKQLIMVPCIAINAKPIQYISAFFGLTHITNIEMKIKLFWHDLRIAEESDFKEFVFEESAPRGSYVAEQIKCLA